MLDGPVRRESSSLTIILGVFMTVENDLYHRPPYLLIDNVVDCTEDYIHAEKKFTGTEFFFQGHFPNAPILPGALMQEMTGQAAGILIARHHNPLGEDYDTNNFDPERPALGVLSRIKDAKFKSFAKPSDELVVKVKLIEKVHHAIEFTGTITKKSTGHTSTGEGELIMKNRFLLTNVPSRMLLS